MLTIVGENISTEQGVTRLDLILAVQAISWIPLVGLLLISGFLFLVFLARARPLPKRPPSARVKSIAQFFLIMAFVMAIQYPTQGPHDTDWNWDFRLGSSAAFAICGSFIYLFALYLRCLELAPEKDEPPSAIVGF